MRSDAARTSAMCRSTIALRSVKACCAPLVFHRAKILASRRVASPFARNPERETSARIRSENPMKASSECRADDDSLE